MGIFSGSGVGKSVLLGMMARYTAAEVIVIALIGERGREVNDFIERDLGPTGLAKSVVVVATSNEPAVARTQAASTATAVAEYFRDQGKDVLLLMDSLTRFALAQREIGLAAGEPPATRGFTPSVFAELPKLVERAGRTPQGSITAFYAVLVEADDPNEPISDAVRGLLDGHTWLSRKLSSRGHYPAIDVLESISRLMPEVADDEHLRATCAIRELLGAYRDHEDLISIGAYHQGSNRTVDAAIRFAGRNRPLPATIGRAALDAGRGTRGHCTRVLEQQPFILGRLSVCQDKTIVCPSREEGGHSWLQKNTRMSVLLRRKTEHDVPIPFSTGDATAAPRGHARQVPRGIGRGSPGGR